MQFIKLANETKMPILGLGTWKSAPTDVYGAVRWGLKLGYTHFDCAFIYNNEEAVGQALFDAMREDGLKREDIFVTSKLWNNAHKKGEVAAALKDSLARLKLEYVDLYLVHWPVAQKKEALMPLSADDMLSLKDVPLEETWEAMEDVYEAGLAKAVGVSNFGVNGLAKLMATAKINPMVNQVECHPYLAQNELKDFCDKNMIALTAYAPLGSGHMALLEDETVLKIAKKNKVQPAQVLLRWNMQRNVAVIPKAVEEKHLRENIGALNIELDGEDMEALSGLDKNERFLAGDVFRIGPYAQTDIFA